MIKRLFCFKSVIKSLIFVSLFAPSGVSHAQDSMAQQPISQNENMATIVVPTQVIGAEDDTEAPEKSSLIIEAIETQKELEKLLMSNEPLQADLAELCRKQEFMSSFDLVRSFSSWSTNYFNEHKESSETLDLSTARNLAISLHAWAYWYEEVLGFRKLQNEIYWPMAVQKGHIRIKSSVYQDFWLWRAILRDTDRVAREQYTKTYKDSLAMRTVSGVASSISAMKQFVGITAKMKEENEKVKSIEDAVNLYEKRNMITEDIPKNWDEMLNDYVCVEDGFYEMIDSCKTDAQGGQSSLSILDQVIKYYEKDYKNNREALEYLKNYQVQATRYFRHLHKLARHEIFDLPTADLSFYWYLKFKLNTDDFYKNMLPFRDNKQKSQLNTLRSCALGFSTVNQFQPHCVFDFEKSAIIRWVGYMKSYYSIENWDEIATQAKQKASWYNMSTRITTPKFSGEN